MFIYIYLMLGVPVVVWIGNAVLAHSVPDQTTEDLDHVTRDLNRVPVDLDHVQIAVVQGHVHIQRGDIVGLAPCLDSAIAGLPPGLDIAIAGLALGAGIVGQGGITQNHGLVAEVV